MRLAAAADCTNEAEEEDQEDLVVQREVPRCRVALIANREAGARPVVAQFATGTLRVLSYKGHLVLALLDDNDGGEWSYTVLPDTPVCIAGTHYLTLPDPDGAEDSVGITFDAGGLGSVVSLLQAFECVTWQQDDPSVAAALAHRAVNRPPPGRAASVVARTVEDTATATTGAIALATGALSWGLRQATSAAKQSPLMEPTEKPVAVPSAAKKGVSGARQVSRAALQIGTSVVTGAAQATGAVAGHMGNALVSMTSGENGTQSRWVADAKHVGQSSLDAGVSVFLALNAAADNLTQESLGCSADLVGHKFGEEAGETTREGFHVVGNLMEAKNLMSTTAVAKMAGKTAAKEAATTMSSSSEPSAPAAGSITLGPRR